MRPPVQITADIEARQRRAGDPLSSVWVSANAGSGKTHVLTERVLRLLLSGVAPDQILCLTYTKAAAAEMRRRVSARLGEWALLPEAGLVARLTAMGGARPDARLVARARTLFAHALETPGGLKIMTIHAFCESVLHRFPKEAGVPFDFVVVEDNERERMVRSARERVLADGLNGIGAAEAVATLFGLMSDSQIGDAIDAALAEQRTLRQVIADVPQAKRNLRKLVGAGNALSRDAVLTAIAGGYGPSEADHAAIFTVAPPDPAGKSFVDRLSLLDAARPDPLRLLDVFLTKEGAARKTLLKKADAAQLPDIAQRLTDEAARLETLAQDLVAAELIERSEALLDVLAAISLRYEAQKRARSLLDFDDLIEALRRLLSDNAIGPWVRYKLDSGIAHILVDESQDTNHEQWQVIEALTGDFFDGDSAVERPRSIFAVGDEKQSIYSFQGADPELFIEAGDRYGMQSRTADLAFDKVELKTSFRTLPDVLRAVDLTFAGEVQRQGVLASTAPVAHDSARRDIGGMVTLWPPIQQADEEIDPQNWPTEAPKSLTQSAARQVAERIAGEIAAWVGKRPLGPRGRLVEANDVLILVQTRGALFREIIRALTRAGLPTPGADRLAVTTHIAVLDLMALGDVLSNPADELQLAALLRSPLFDVSEDDLFAIAHPEGRKGLWEELSRSSIPSVAAAYRRLAGWRGRLDFERPFEFFAEMLYAGGGLRRFHARLGGEVDDVLAAFLDLALQHEQAPQPSMQGFLAALREADVTIKRELAEGGGGVRVMTVHGAKGLEAPIVILADAASKQDGRTGKPVYLQGGTRPLLVHAGGLAAHTPQTLEIRVEDEANLAREYWRKLYVGMTRAEDELYVTGVLTKIGKLENSWYEAIDLALRPEADIVIDGDDEIALVFPRQRPAPAPVTVPPPLPLPSTEAVLPELPDYRRRRIIRPSSALAEIAPDQALETAAERTADLRDPEAARREGIALHALLQHLAALDPDLRPAIAAQALAQLLPEAPGMHAALAARALSILTRPTLAHLFGPDSRAEVPLLAQATRNGLPVTIAGRIDRLIVSPGRVLIVDYKSDAAQPDGVEGVSPAYLTQMGLYALVAGQLFPGLEVGAAILWTGLESLMNLPSDKLASAVAGFTIG